MRLPITPLQAAIALEINPVSSNTETLVTATLNAIEDALILQGHYSDLGVIAALATIRVECGQRFAPVREVGNAAYFLSRYWDNVPVAKVLGNTEQADAIKFCGRGYIQLTGRWNYAHYSKVLAPQDLIANPDLALDPANAAHIFVHYFGERKVWEAADRADWARVRKIVNGGENGLALFLKCVTNLLQAVQNASTGNKPV